MPQQVQQGPNGYPIIHGIELVPTSRLPDRIRAVFDYKHLNAVQSKCFSSIYETSDNFVLSAPTGSGKTAILELAICRLIATSQPHQFKVIYQAPTKALCSERQSDWSKRFRQLDVNVVELTGDTEVYQLKAISHADIIVTTPEKWDSMTRKWKDHKKFMELVKLFLIDEVHILKEERGASLEAVVSRMKSVGNHVRFVALSATVPNSDDIATWLGRNSENPNQPARREVFGEDFRPVKLNKHLVGLQGPYNDFAFDKACTDKLPDVISRYGHERKPIIIFCFTRKSCDETAEMLSKWWSSSQPQYRLWSGSSKQMQFKDQVLKQYASTGVAFHHAGLDTNDRVTIEKAYLEGNINVICCTSTLAVGVNLPCHLVIIKNTLVYDQTGNKEYSDLEIMQMLGRAGRPQFDTSAIAVIMTRNEKVQHYENMMSGQEVLESRLHINLIEHLNAEIGLGTVFDRQTARQWMEGTFFFVRLSRNIAHYKISGKLKGRDAQEIVENLCEEHLQELRKFHLIEGAGGQNIRSTEFGDAMARYYVLFETMKLFMGLQRKAKISEILSAIACAAEFKQIRLRSKEKVMLRDINNSPAIKFSIKVDLAMPAHKVSLLIQATLGGIDLRNDDRFRGIASQIQSESNSIYQHVTRLIRCIVDCQLQLEDSVATRNALELSRSLGARSWDDSPLQLLQVPKLGPVSVRKLVTAGIRNIEQLELTEPHKIEHTLSKNPPFGMQVLSDLRDFPRLRVALRTIGEPRIATTEKGKRVRIRLKAEISFLNDTVPTHYNKKPVYVCVLAETSDGHVVHFARLSAAKIGAGIEMQYQADLFEARQLINCWGSCDDFAGTQKLATLHPAIASGLFTADMMRQDDRPILERVSKHESKKPQSASTQDEDDFGNQDLDDADLVAAAEPPPEYQDIDDVVSSQDDRAASLAGKGKPRKPTIANHAQKRAATNEDNTVVDVDQREPKRLRNGNWECNHRCTDKEGCKHTCCKHGLESKPKPRKPKKAKVDESVVSSTAKPAPKNTKNVKKTANTAHTDPFAAAKKTAYQSLAIRLKPAERPPTRETEFGDENEFWDDPEVEDALMNDSGYGRPDLLDTSKPKFTAGGLFVTSSPDKAQPYDEIDLSSETQKEHRHGKRPASNTAIKTMKRARVIGVPEYTSNHQDYDQHDAQFVSLRDLDTSCNITTFSKGPVTSRAIDAMQATRNHTLSDDSPVINCNDAPYGWAPINSTDNSPSNMLDNPQGMTYDSDGDDGLSIVGSALYPTTFTAVNEPRLARRAQSRHVDEQDMEIDDILPALSDVLRPAEHESAAANVDRTNGDLMLDTDDDGELQDEGYITMQIDQEPTKPCPLIELAETQYRSMADMDGQDEGYITMQIDEESTKFCPLTEMAETQYKRISAGMSGQDETHLANEKHDNANEAKDEIPAWMYEEYGDVADFV